MSEAYIIHGFIRRKGPWTAEIDPIATGEQLRSKRLQHKLSQEALSVIICDLCVESAGRSAISSWETGKKRPSWDHVAFLAWLYNCTIDELIVRFQDTDPDDPGPARPLIIFFFSPSRWGTGCDKQREKLYHMRQRSGGRLSRPSARSFAVCLVGRIARRAFFFPGGSRFVHQRLADSAPVIVYNRISKRDSGAARRSFFPVQNGLFVNWRLIGSAPIVLYNIGST